MLRQWILLLILAACAMAQAPRFTADGQLTLPADYREWVFLSSGLGMSYDLEQVGPPTFTNVFVNPAAYRSFLATGKWPDKTMLVLEIRASSSKGSINRAGSYQGSLVAIEGEVKDSKRFLGNGWVFFGFGKASTGKIFPHTQDCYGCHLEAGAVDNTFVQFYPTLLEIAKRKGTLKP